jgi:flagellar motor switch protein FliG
MESIKDLVKNLRQMDPATTDIFQTTSEVLEQEVIDYVKWEKDDAYPALRKVIGEERAAELGEQIRVNEKLIYAEQIKKY